MNLDTESLLIAAGHVDRIAERARGRTVLAHELEGVPWHGPLRDRIVGSVASVVTTDSRRTASVLEQLAGALRALARSVEERLAQLRRIEAEVRAVLAQQIRVLETLGSRLRSELAAATHVVGGVVSTVVGGVVGDTILRAGGTIAAKLTAVEHRLLRLRALASTLPPAGDLRWESLATALQPGA